MSVRSLYFAVEQTINGTGAKVDIPKVEAENVVANLLSFFFAIMGSVAVLMVVIGAIKMVYAQGDPQNAAKARNTIIYAVFGLIISMAAFGLVKFFTGEIKL